MPNLKHLTLVALLSFSANAGMFDPVDKRLQSIEHLYLAHMTKMKVNYVGKEDPTSYISVQPGEIWVSELNTKDTKNYVVKKREYGFLKDSWKTIKTINVYDANKLPEQLKIPTQIPGIKGVNNAN